MSLDSTRVQQIEVNSKVHNLVGYLEAVPSEWKDTYQYSPIRKKFSLRRILSEFFISKLKEWRVLSPHFEMVNSWRYTRPHAKRLEDKILELFSDDLRRRSYRDEYIIVMGIEDFLNLGKESGKNSNGLNPAILSLTADIRNYNSGHQFVGVPVYVVPGFDGITLLPKRIFSQ